MSNRVRKYIKKPVEIEAIQWLGYNWNEVCDFLTVPINGRGQLENGADMCVIIETLEGEMRATIGDYIIKGVRGEFYPCKAGIFEETYERAL